VPQFVRFVFVFVSQPLLGFESQLWNPAAHTGVHTLAWHDVVPFGFVHAVPHAPQLLALFDEFVSQPVAYCPSQSLKGAVQLWIAQAVPLHVGVPLSTAQTLPQAPQALTLFVVAVSQPSVTLALQLP